MKKHTPNAKASKPSGKKSKFRATKAEVFREIPREPASLPVAQLHIAPWNPRGKITPESVSDLVPSIKAKGLIQPRPRRVS